MPGENILIVDDEKNILKSLSSALRHENYKIFTATTGNEALELISKENIDLIMLDVWLPDINGLDIIEKIKKISSHIVIIMMSGHSTIETAVKSTKLGAYDFLEKPISLDKIKITIKHALHFVTLEKENFLLRQQVETEIDFVGKSPPMLQLKESIRRAAPSLSWVLITGDNGTGKEMVAKSIHSLSNRKDKPFVKVNCAAIPEELIESELFGHEKGSFTGAVNRHLGKFEMADKGTLFLDEVGDMSLGVQAKVLRALQEQEFERVGGSKTLKVNIRVIAATNKDLAEEIRTGRFRKDLYYRLNVIPLKVPRLESRQDDIPLLAEHFISILVHQTGLNRKEIDEDAMEMLMTYSWPGNVRELKNTIERLMIMVPTDIVPTDDIAAVLPLSPIDRGKTPRTLKEMMQEIEKDIIVKKLKFNNGNVALTARKLGLERSNLYKKLRQYDLNQ